ncbi:MAG: ABC transporter permease [Panacibacter sp.]
MFRNYLKIAWRNLWKHKLFSFINIFGLALSLSVCMMVMIQVKDDLSYDLFHPNAERTYRILSDIVENKNNKQYELASTPLPLRNELGQQHDLIEAAVQLYPAIKEKAEYEGKKLYINGAFTDTSFFKVFGFELSSGNKQTALAVANGIILSNETAIKFFGKTDPVGQVLNFETLGLFQVTGVIKSPPGKSHLDFDAYASSLLVPQLEKTKVLPALQHNWNSMNNSYTYVVVKRKITADNLDKLLTQVSSKPELNSKEGKISFISQPLSSITPGTDGIYNEIGKGTVWAKVLTIIGVGLIILLAACFNYTNLTIARALTRAKEVGIRKVAGATRHQIFAQYIVEALLIALLALSFAWIGLLQFRQDTVLSYQIIIATVLFTILSGIMAGALPAWILSSFKPVQVLKSISTQKIFGNLSLQKGLMIFQFSLSLLVIIFLSAYYRQFSYLETLNPGFTSDNILTVPISSNEQVFSNEISGINGIGTISRASEDFGMRGSGSIQVFSDKPGTQQGVLCDFYFADAATLPLHQLTIISGSNFLQTKNLLRKNIFL